MTGHSRMFRRRIVPGLLLALSLSVAGCDSGSDKSAPTDEQAASAAAAATAGTVAAGTAKAWPPIPEGQAPHIDMKKALTANYYLVLDGSGSMMQSECSNDQLKMDVAEQAMENFIAQIPADANVGLAVFDANGLSERVPLAIDNRKQLKRAIEEVRADESTPLKSAITLGYQKLEAQGVSQLGYGEYHLVVVTDGQAQPDEEDPREIVDTVLRESPVVIHTVGFCIGDDHSLNQPGRTFYAAADSPEALQQGLSAVLAEAPSFDATTFQH
jgi:Mg-chelatase subunit ChlD